VIHHSLRFPDDLYDRLKAAAGRDRRSVHAEILMLLADALEPEDVQPAAVLTSYQARPGRRVLVITDLADLRGPARGKVILPLRLYWSPAGRIWNLDDSLALREMYQVVLNEAIREGELAGWLNGPRLVETWRDLYLPRGVRQAWEEHHEVLRAAQPADTAA
jgi:plasmid stability protein